MAHQNIRINHIKIVLPSRIFISRISQELESHWIFIKNKYTNPQTFACCWIDHSHLLPICIISPRSIERSDKSICRHTEKIQWCSEGTDTKLLFFNLIDIQYYYSILIISLSDLFKLYANYANVLLVVWTKNISRGQNHLIYICSGLIYYNYTYKYPWLEYYQKKIK